MVSIEGGAFTMGSDEHYPEEGPAHRAQVGSFWIDRTTVTNAEFARFVSESGYITDSPNGRSIPPCSQAPIRRSWCRHRWSSGHPTAPSA